MCNHKPTIDDCVKALNAIGVYVEAREGLFNEIQSENYKLRNLVQDYYIYDHHDCPSCFYYDECQTVNRCQNIDGSTRTSFCIASARLAKRVKELKK